MGYVLEESRLRIHYVLVPSSLILEMSSPYFVPLYIPPHTVAHNQQKTSIWIYWHKAHHTKSKKMSRCLTNLTVTRPISSQSQRNSINYIPLCSRFPKGPSSLVGGQNTIRAMTGNGKESLDHLQRANKIQAQQPKRRTPQTAPIGMFYATLLIS